MTPARARMPHAALAFAITLHGTASAASERYACAVSPTSTFSQSTLIALPLAGTWIGNHDATANPGGTRTIPGLFGGSGNNAIPFTSTVKPGIGITDANPSGSFVIVIDRTAGTCVVEGLSLDVLNGEPGTVATNLVVSFSTFRTVAPNSTFIGVSNFTIPLEAGVLTAATASQSGVAAGTVTANPDGTWFPWQAPRWASRSRAIPREPWSSAGRWHSGRAACRWAPRDPSTRPCRSTLPRRSSASRSRSPPSFRREARRTCS
jgi:hypothetical protein